MSDLSRQDSFHIWENINIVDEEYLNQVYAYFGVNDDPFILTRGRSRIFEEAEGIPFRPPVIQRTVSKMQKTQSAVVKMPSRPQFDFLNDNIPVVRDPREVVKEEAKNEEVKHSKRSGRRQNEEEKKHGSRRKKSEKLSNKIIQVIQIVIEWRQHCYKDRVRKGTPVLSKTVAAKMVGLKKKSLDDFLMYIRKGIVAGFPFQAKKNDKFGELRRFIIESKEKQKWAKENHIDVEELYANLRRED